MRIKVVSNPLPTENNPSSSRLPMSFRPPSNSGSKGVCSNPPYPYRGRVRPWGLRTRPFLANRIVWLRSCAEGAR